MRSRNALIMLLVLVVLILLFLLIVTQGGVQPSIRTTPISVATPLAGLEEPSKEIVEITKEAATGAADVVQRLLNELSRVPKSDVVRILFVLAGALLLLGGWRIYDYIVTVAGFVVGAAIAISLVSTANIALNLAALLVGGLIGVALSHFMVGLTVFLIGAYLGIILTDALGQALKMMPVSSLAMLIGGIVGGMLLIALSSELLVIAAVLIGAQLLVLGLGLQPIWLTILAVLGLIMQFVAVRAFRYEFRRPRASLFRDRRNARV